ncbi:IclR family transcriptional regulator [Marinobacterium litorale]|uniref:IclR family transcriptional regulator n=1 Tax=Marinobacterium litorale TaxID=404770 RepID=UPI0003F5E2D2|nr:IclR family transcriptional regulator [Marinobacterium litorale]
MATSLLQRALGALELLANQPLGLTLKQVSDQLPMPKAGAQRLLNELNHYGYVALNPHNDCYVLTTKLSAMALRYQADKGITDVAQPHLETLASQCGELVRLAVADESGLNFVAMAQGMRAGLRYDPSPFEPVPLYCTATAFAWLTAFDDQEALDRIEAAGPLDTSLRGPNVPKKLSDIPPYLAQTRERGYCYVADMSSPGMAALAVPLYDKNGDRIIGSLVIGAPTARLGEAEINAYLEPLQATAKRLSELSQLSEYLRHAKS